MSGVALQAAAPPSDVPAAKAQKNFTDRLLVVFSLFYKKQCACQQYKVLREM
jgi:hypothetical protein